MEINEALGNWGISRRYQGYNYLARSIELVLDNPDMLMALTKELYPTIGREYSVSPQSVERNIRTVIKAWWSSPHSNRFKQLMSSELCCKPTSGQFIELLCTIVRMNHTARTPDPSDPEDRPIAALSESAAPIA